MISTATLVRALALLGYGTESALEMDTKTVVDSPSKPAEKGNGMCKGNGQSSSVQALIPLPIVAASGKANDDVSRESPSVPAREEPAKDGTRRREAQPAITCSDCQGAIGEGKLRDGTVLTAKEVAERSRKRFNRPLCARCLTKQMVQERPKEAKAV